MKSSFRVLTSNFLPVALLLVSCNTTSAPVTAPIRIGGSQTIAKGVQTLIKNYQKTHDIAFEVKTEGQSSGLGIDELISGKIDIARSSRPIKENELINAMQKSQPIKMFQIGYDCIVIVVHPKFAEKLNNINLETINKIFFTGQIKNWNQLNPMLKGPIEVIIRDEGGKSGTLEIFKEVVTKSTKTELVKTAILYKNLDEFLTSLNSHDHFISFVSVKELTKNITSLPIKNNSLSTSCTQKDILSGDYPLVRGIFLVSHVPGTLSIMEFISYGLSLEGQKLIKSEGFLPIREVPDTIKVEPSKSEK